MLKNGPDDQDRMGFPAIDLNCDMGEGMHSDLAIMPFVSSVNIACGYHAGDSTTMRKTVKGALEQGCCIGAHPSYPDRENFGRRDLLSAANSIAGATLTPESLRVMLIDQIRLLQGVCEEYGARLHHVKPHGALYNRAAKDPSVATLICQVIKELDPTLILYGLSGSLMQGQAALQGIAFVNEVFADRTYREDGSLSPRSEPHALIVDPMLAVEQVLTMVLEGKVRTVNGKEIALAAGSVCIHGDGPHALEFAEAIYGALTGSGIFVRAL